MTRRINLPSIGSRGDIHPYIVLASALQDKGYEVIVATHPCMQEMVEFFEVPFKPIGPDVDIGLEVAAMWNRSFHFIFGMFRVIKFIFAMLEKIHEDLLNLSRQADLILVSHSAAGCMSWGQGRSPYRGQS